MRIKTVIHQSRRNMAVIFECEHCGATTEGWALDDEDYRRNAIPRKRCPECGQSGAQQASSEVA